MPLAHLLLSAALAGAPQTSVDVHRIRLGYASSYLVQYRDAVVLVDTGLSSSAGRILRVAERHGVQPGDIDLIVLTHVHKDHAGGAAELHRRTGAPVAVQARGERLLAEGRGAPTLPVTPTGKLVALFGKGHRLPALEAQVVVDDFLDLEPWGLPGLLVSTPGHTACSMSLVVPGELAIVGDLLIAPRRKPHLPNLREQPESILPSLEAVLELGPAQIWAGHTGPMRPERVSRLLPHSEDES